MSELAFTVLRQGQSGPEAEPFLRLEALSVRVGIRKVIENLSLQVFNNEAILISGPNGSGKSTLLNAIAGMEPAQIEGGTITIAGEDVTNLPAHERSRRGVAYLQQRRNVFVDLSVGENLCAALGKEGPARFCTTFPDWAMSLPLNKRVGLLSGGQKQRLAWAMCTLRPHNLLLADEPEAGLSGHLNLPSAGTFLMTSHDSRHGHWEAM